MNEAVVVALGSNLSGDYDSSKALLEAAVEALGTGGFRITARSRWWASAAWPDPSDPPYLNGVVLAQTALAPADAMIALHRIEEAFGRRRHDANAPRTLDLDLIAHGRQVTMTPAIPHPRAHERLFVMGPLAEIAPDWRHPVLGETAASLAKGANVGNDARPMS